MTQPLSRLVQEVAHLLMTQRTRIVFAESCTAGLISAVLARVPGISEFHCGSAVVYRLETKSCWLGVPGPLLIDPGPVSEAVARAMVVGVLDRTPEAMLAAAITGHLGPGAPSEQDGLVYIGLARRDLQGTQTRVLSTRLPDRIEAPADTGAESLREWRQWKAVELVLTHVRDDLTRAMTSKNPP